MLIQGIKMGSVHSMPCVSVERNVDINFGWDRTFLWVGGVHILIKH